MLGGDEEIDARVPVVAMQLLPPRDPADRLAVHRDDEGGDAFRAIGVVPAEELVPVEVVIGLAPMAGDAGLAQDLQEARKVGLVHVAKKDARSLKDRLHVMTTFAPLASGDPGTIIVSARLSGSFGESNGPDPFDHTHACRE